MSAQLNFHEVRFPLDIALGARGGPERRTDIVTLASGKEERNARWAHSRRKYNAGYGVRSFASLEAVIAFFEERRGKLYGFRYRDPLDFKSCSSDMAPTALDQQIGIGDGITAVFDLYKTYGSGAQAYTRPIKKPVAASVLIAVNGIALATTTAWSVDETSGQITFQPAHIPPMGALITAGFMFDVAVRFDADSLDISLASFRAGELPDIPLIELML